MKDILEIQDIEKIERLENEYDLQKASLLERKLRLMIDESPDLKPIRKRLRDLIKNTRIENGRTLRIFQILKLKNQIKLKE